MTDPNKLGALAPQALAAFHSQRLAIVQAVVTQSLQQHDNVVQHGDKAEQLLTTGLDFTTQALEVAMSLGDTSMLEYQLQWAHERLQHDGVQAAHILQRFQILQQTIMAVLPQQDADQVEPYILWMIARQRDLMHIEESNE